MYNSERAAKLAANKVQKPTIIQYTSGQNKGKFAWLSDSTIVELDRSGNNLHYIELARWSNTIPLKWINYPKW